MIINVGEKHKVGFISKTERSSNYERVSSLTQFQKYFKLISYIKPVINPEIENNHIDFSVNKNILLLHMQTCVLSKTNDVAETFSHNWLGFYCVLNKFWIYLTKYFLFFFFYTGLMEFLLFHLMFFFPSSLCFTTGHSPF